MKTKQLLLAAMIGLGASGLAWAADAKTDQPAKDSPVQVDFIAPEKFTDIRDGFGSSQKGEQASLLAISDYVKTEARKYLGADQQLVVTITDIDLAGDFEPWHKPGMDDVRIVKDIYPPRIDLTFTLTDASGKVIKEGKRELRDLSFMMKLTIRRDDPYRYEQALLGDWLRKEFKDAAAKKN